MNETNCAHFLYVVRRQTVTMHILTVDDAIRSCDYLLWYLWGTAAFRACLGLQTLLFSVCILSQYYSHVRSARLVHDALLCYYHLLETSQVVQPHQVNQILGTVEGEHEVYSQ